MKTVSFLCNDGRLGSQRSRDNQRGGRMSSDTSAPPALRVKGQENTCLALEEVVEEPHTGCCWPGCQAPRRVAGGRKRPCVLCWCQGSATKACRWRGAPRQPVPTGGQTGAKGIMAQKHASAHVCVMLTLLIKKLVDVNKVSQIMT